MSSYLIVANQTLGGETLDRAVRERIGRGSSEFYVVVPVTDEPDEVTWQGGFETPHFLREVGAYDKAHERAEHRLSRMTEQIRAAGGRAEGEVGSADALEAVKQVLRRETFDEVIVSTLPSGVSRWLKRDLPSRISRATESKVTTIKA